MPSNRKKTKPAAPFTGDQIDSYLKSLGTQRSAATVFTQTSGYWHYLMRRNRDAVPEGFDGEFDDLIFRDPRIDIGILADTNSPDELTPLAPLKALNYSLTRFDGPFLDLGNGSWVVTGTAYGTKQYGSDPPFGNISATFLVQYTAPTDTLELAIGECNWVSSNVSAPDSPVSLYSDISVPKIAIRARQRLSFSCLNFSQGNYFTLQP